MPDVIYSYSRSDALADGVLIDVSDIAREAGFTLPVAVSDNLYHSYIMPSLELAKEGQSPSGRLWDTLNVLRYAIKASPGDRSSFSLRPLYHVPEHRPHSRRAARRLRPRRLR